MLIRGFLIFFVGVCHGAGDSSSGIELNSRSRENSNNLSKGEGSIELASGSSSEEQEISAANSDEVTPTTKSSIRPTVPNIPMTTEPAKPPQRPMVPEVPKKPQWPTPSEVIKTQQWPAAPQTPFIPNIPQMPFVPQMPNIPFMPQMPNTPFMPDIPKLPFMPEMPKIPFMPEMPKIPFMPEMPKIPVMPEMPKIPVMPEMPKIPIMPEMPKIPFMPEMPKKPFVPEMPKAPIIPETPYIPVVPEKPERPQLPQIPQTPEIPYVKPSKPVQPVMPPRPSQKPVDQSLVLCSGGRYEDNKCVSDVWSYRVDITKHSDIPANTWIQKATKAGAKKLMKKVSHMFKNKEVWTFENEIHKLPFYLKSLPILRRGARPHKPNFIIPGQEPLYLHIDAIQVKSSQFLQSWNLTKTAHTKPESCGDESQAIHHDCYKKGYFPNFWTTSCTGYIYCDNTLEGTLYPSYLTCPENSFFDPNVKICSANYKCRI